MDLDDINVNIAKSAIQKYTNIHKAVMLGLLESIDVELNSVTTNGGAVVTRNGGEFNASQSNDAHIALQSVLLYRQLSLNDVTDKELFIIRSIADKYKEFYGFYTNNDILKIVGYPDAIDAETDVEKKILHIKISKTKTINMPLDTVYTKLAENYILNFSEYKNAFINNYLADKQLFETGLSVVQSNRIAIEDAHIFGNGQLNIEQNNKICTSIQNRLDDIYHDIVGDEDDEVTDEISNMNGNENNNEAVANNEPSNVNTAMKVK